MAQNEMAQNEMAQNETDRITSLVELSTLVSFQKLRDRINPYNVEAHKELAKFELLEAAYTMDEIDSWIEAIE